MIQEAKESTKPISLMRLPDVMAQTGLGRSSLWNAVKKGTFPGPVNIGLRAVAWPSTSVEAWIKGRIDASQRAGV